MQFGYGFVIYWQNQIKTKAKTRNNMILMVKIQNFRETAIILCIDYLC